MAFERMSDFLFVTQYEVMLNMMNTPATIPKGKYIREPSKRYPLSSQDVPSLDFT